MPMMDSMRTGLRNSALRPFSGCVRTSGWMPGGGRLRRLADLAEQARTVFALVDVNRLQPFDLLLGVLGKIIIGIVHIDVLGIAATRGQFNCEQRRGLGRARVVGVVGMERLPRITPFAVYDLVIGNVFHVGVAGDVALSLVVRLKLAE